MTQKVWQFSEQSTQRFWVGGIVTRDPIVEVWVGGSQKFDEIIMTLIIYSGLSFSDESLALEGNVLMMNWVYEMSVQNPKGIRAIEVLSS